MMKEKELTVKEFIKKNNKKEIWDKYCNFLELSIEEFMKIQKEEMNKQIPIWTNNEIGKTILCDKRIKNLNEFRRKVPLTTYENYADVLLPMFKKDNDSLENKNIWIQTTWEGGLKPVKVAPYTRGMLDTFRDNIISCLILSSSDKKYDFKFKYNDKMLYGLAPLPFLTGLVPYSLSECSDVKIFPPVEKAINMPFKDRNALGFKMSMQQNVDLFFGLGSVAYAVTETLTKKDFSKSKTKISELLDYKISMLRKIFKAKKISKRENRTILPKDLFDLKCFMVAGTDNKCYKDDLEKSWGIRPLELFAGTEMSLIGTETHNRNGLYFFPKTCFYEFVKLKDVLEHKIYGTPITKTYLLDEVESNEQYELVISSLQGGAFARYRTGDVYKCLALKDEINNVNLPRFEYIDRVPWIIDIAGFSRFNEKEIDKIIKKSDVKVNDWYATKSYTENNKPVLHLYLECKEEENIYKKIDETFSNFDDDYNSLKRILGTNPLKITYLPNGKIRNYFKNDSEFLKVNSFKEIKL